MSTIQYMLLSLVLLTVAVEAKKILRAQEGAATTGNFMVTLDVDTPNERFDELVEMVGIHAADQKIHKINGHYAKIITAKLSETSLEMIKDEANVKYVEEETMRTKSQSAPWHLDRINQRQLPLDGSFALAQTGAGVDIYILDTGIRYTHDEFGDRAEYGGLDPIDDITGSNRRGLDCDGHGTHVAGLAGGSTYGAATDATLYSVRVLDCDGNGPVAASIAGINHAATEISNANRPGIISMSLGGPSVQAEIDAVEAAVADGVPVIVAAGNDDIDACTESPAAAPNAVTVGATDRNDARSGFSNHGACLDIFAPGSDITSASHNCDDCTVVFSGTSMACPITSGVAATLLEADDTLTPAQLTQRLIDLSTPNIVTDPKAGSPNRLLYGRVVANDGGQWPSGPYALPKPTLGCPNEDNLEGEGYVYQDNEDNNNENSVSDPLPLSGQFDRNTRIYYCAYSSGGSGWPSGSYCLAKYTGSCPSGFTEGSIYWDDEDSSNENSISGSVPTGAYDRNTRIYYCCRSDGSIATAMTLPTGKQFFLYQYSSDGCQEVAGMSVRQVWRYSDDEDNNNENSVTSPHPYGEFGRNSKVYFCYYF